MKYDHKVASTVNESVDKKIQSGIHLVRLIIWSIEYSKIKVIPKQLLKDCNLYSLGHSIPVSSNICRTDNSFKNPFMSVRRPVQYVYSGFKDQNGLVLSFSYTLDVSPYLMYVRSASALSVDVRLWGGNFLACL